ncbi:MAG: hypothetical protein MJ246_09035 [Clostridia bacterium]|nr:hypothetical protein [Clostridia bacterium]
MPHSSGGGSSHGGSHHGSSRSVRRSYHHGDKRFVRYKKDGSQEIVYSDRNISFISKGINYLGVMLAAILAGCSIYIGLDSFQPREKIDTSCYDSVIWIEDGAHEIGNPTKLGNRLDEFQELTGISICVKTMYDSEWKKESGTLESYAYKDYLRKFDDEYHWYLIYSVNDDKGKDKWSWEGMQGDNTDVMLTSKYADKFTDTVQSSLKSGESFEIAVIKGLDEISPKIMTSADLSMFFGAVLLFILICYGAYALFIENKTGNKTRYMRVPGDAKEDLVMTRCYTCGREHVKGSVPCCPYCYNIDRYKFDPFYRKKVKNELEVIPHD